MAFASASAAGSVEFKLFNTGASSGECVQPQPAAFPSTASSFAVRAVCEWHCQHDHIAPYPWTVELFPTSGYLLGWPNSPCLPKLGAGRSSCVVQMPTYGGRTAATPFFGTTADTAPPTPPVASASPSSYSITVSWSASSDPWLAGYDVYLNGAPKARVGPTTTIARLEGISCNTPYSVQVAAFDAWNEMRSNTVSTRTGACVGSSDTRRPNTVFHVKPPRVTRSRTASFHFGANERARFRCKLDRRAWAKCRRSDRYVLAMGKTYRRLRPGYHTFRVRAIDRAGNRERSPAVYRWRIRR
jgi:hypothetical protein